MEWIPVITSLINIICVIIVMGIDYKSNRKLTKLEYFMIGVVIVNLICAILIYPSFILCMR